jgi:predicted HicB family RNase H-like nuclease
MKTTKPLTNAEDILKLPYAWNLVRQPDGSWFAEIREIPGCYVHKDTQEDAIQALRIHARELLSILIKDGKRVPAPVESEFSGHFALRLPKNLHRRAALYAQQDGASLNQFIVAVVSAAVGAQDYHSALANRTFQFVAQAGSPQVVKISPTSPPAGAPIQTPSTTDPVPWMNPELRLEGEKPHG